MKKAIKILGVLMLLITALSFSSCSRDDDPVNNDFFAGTYKGKVSYNDGGSTNISTDNGSVFVTKIASGTKYNFAFSNSIPDLNGIEFEQKETTVLL
jgi:hypothetical protein